MCIPVNYGASIHRYAQETVVVKRIKSEVKIYYKHVYTALRVIATYEPISHTPLSLV